MSLSFYHHIPIHSDKERGRFLCVGIFADGDFVILVEKIKLAVVVEETDKADIWTQIFQGDSCFSSFALMTRVKYANTRNLIEEQFYVTIKGEFWLNFALLFFYIFIQVF